MLAYMFIKSQSHPIIRNHLKMQSLSSQSKSCLLTIFLIKNLDQESQTRRQRHQYMQTNNNSARFCAFKTLIVNKKTLFVVKVKCIVNEIVNFIFKLLPADPAVS